MRIKHVIVPKYEVKYCLEDFSLQRAFDLLNKTGYRCVPVLSANGKKFLGNIYVAHILKYAFEDKSKLEENIMVLVSDKDAHVDSHKAIQHALTEVFLYPYLAVTDRDGDFEGILTHKNVIELLNDALGLKTKGVSFAITTSEFQGALARFSNIMKKHSNINSMIAFDDGDRLVRRMNFSVPKETTQEEVEAIQKALETNGFRVVEIERSKDNK